MAEENDELTRLKEIELPVFNMLNAHTSLGIGIDVDHRAGCAGLRGCRT
jgi:hypothetical protein